MECLQAFRHFPGGGVLSGKVDTGMCGLDRVPFRPLRFTNGSFYLKNGLDKGRVFAKCLIFDDFLSSGLLIGCQKVLNMNPNLHGKKY